MRILHVLRAPVGGLFRHVRDLSKRQAQLGHEVGVVCDAGTSDALTDARLNDLSAHLSLGLTRTVMPRGPGAGDVTAVRHVMERLKTLECDVAHGHGAKGGAYARLAASFMGSRVAAFYTPHGGSLHYDPKTLQGRFFMTLERRLARRTAGLIFESAYSQRVFADQVGAPSCAQTVIPNGLLDEEFVDHDEEQATVDVLYIGELRELKGVDVLLNALAALQRDRQIKALIVGAGPDDARFRALSSELGLDANVTFAGAQPAAQVFAAARCLAVPSRAESFPYIVLEAAARALPLIATNVGGIPEIVAGTSTKLIAPDDPAALASAIARCLDNYSEAMAAARELQAKARVDFSVAAMTDAVVAFYESARKTTR